jgi:hypothetical protein
MWSGALRGSQTLASRRSGMPIRVFLVVDAT